MVIFKFECCKQKVLNDTSIEKLKAMHLQAVVKSIHGQCIQDQHDNMTAKLPYPKLRFSQTRSFLVQTQDRRCLGIAD